MIFAEDFLKILNSETKFFSGVPDSVLKNFTHIIENNADNIHIVSTNEGSAVAKGVGYHLSTKNIPCIYMQNSGLTNALNPLLSISHQKVYSIPLILVIGWRGSPNSNDEPQHLVMGSITRNILRLSKIKFLILKNNNSLKKVKKLILYAKKKSTPIAILIENNTLKIKTEIIKRKKINNHMSVRSEVIDYLLSQLKQSVKIISTTGFTSRELEKIKKDKHYNTECFYMIGGMGHAAMVTLGATLKSSKKIICLDGDGSLLMHLGSLTLIKKFGNKKFYHVLLNNGSHESVGTHTTMINDINIKEIVKSFGYKKYFLIDNKKKLKNLHIIIEKYEGPIFINVKIKIGVLMNLSRPKNFLRIKNKFMNG
jgi:phosphonopyruvate decarboxylase